MNQTLGWTLAALAIAAGYVGWGWRGVVLGLTVVVFWLVLQFSQALRAMRGAAQSPLGWTDNAVMLHAKLRPGMRLLDLIRLTRSLGRPVPRADGEPETFVWQDGAGDAVRVELVKGQVTVWTLERHDATNAGAGAAGPAA